ncbi:MAG: flavin reductase family protein [Candidatus Aminicenantes bacterium]|jgi:flavin reductase (DIM6/NTAB) family NADH-FMN oxidoreductase RutF
MEKITVKKDLFCLPWTQTILGTHLGGKVNFMALDWLTRVNYQPPMLGICVNRNNASSEAILNTQEFSVNVPNIDMVEITDYTGIVSGKSVDKSDLFPVFYGDLKAAPMITSCPLTMELKLAKTVDLPTNYFFIGEIINIYTEEQFLTDGKPDIAKIKPFLLTMPDNKFWSIGECVGKAWSDGVAMRDRLKNKT